MPISPWLTPNAVALDKKTGADWIREQQDVSEICRKGCWVQQAADNGQDPIKQSYLGNLTQIKGGGVEKYWTESEVYRCKGRQSAARDGAGGKDWPRSHHPRPAGQFRRCAA
jgi:monoamine oxidase